MKILQVKVSEKVVLKAGRSGIYWHENKAGKVSEKHVVLKEFRPLVKDLPAWK